MGVCARAARAAGMHAPHHAAPALKRIAIDETGAAAGARAD